MKILVLSDLPQFVTGGAEVQAARLISYWSGAGHEVKCLGRRMTGNQVTIDGHRVAITRIRMIDGLGRWVRALSFFASLSALLLNNRSWADVIYCRFLGESAATAALLKHLGLLPVPLVATPANAGGAGDAKHLQSVPAWRWLVRLLDRHVDAINLIAEGMAAELRALGFSGANFRHIPNGVPVRRLEPTARKTRQWTLVGRLTRQKAVDVLIEALSAVPVPANAPQILIVGDGPERERLGSLARATPWRSRLRFAGGVPADHVQDLLAESELFLLPSRYEGMSNSGLEAMERGLPVLLSRCGGLDHYITPDRGWVVPPGDVQALRQSLLAALDASPERLAAMGTACRILVETTFDMQVIAGRYLELFAHLITRRTDA